MNLVPNPTLPDDPTFPEFVASDRVPDGVPVLGVPVFTDLSVPDGSGAQVRRDFLEQRRFEGRPGQAQAVLADDGSTVVALGVGERGKVDLDAFRRAGAALARQAGATDRLATTLVAAANGRAGAAAAAVVEGIGLGAYRYSGAPERVGAPSPRRRRRGGRLSEVTVVGAPAAAVRRGQVAVEATCRARDWVNRPARSLTPRELARLAADAAAAAGVGIEVWDEQRIAAERLGCLLGVAAGAEEPPRLIRLEYRARRPRATIALVGKGITFDSGGLSIKPASSMMTMKSDMGGAAAVICATIAAGRLGAPVNVVGWVAATENMPSGTAIHPGDVLTARNGKTVEVLNTDAEGRLVLADALSLAGEEQPDAIVDVATLTGGQRVALGDGVAAVMGNDDALVGRVVDAAAAAGEPAWRLPLFEPYRRHLHSEVADLKNVTGGPAASTIMAGLFLQEFARGQAWAHLDIAAPSWSDAEDGPIGRGATGWGTRTLIELVSGW